MTEEERHLGRRWFEEVWNEGRREAIAKMLSPEVVLHEAGIDSAGPESFYPFYDRLRAALSEVHVDVDDSLADENTICVRWVFTGKHTGEGLDVPPSRVAVNVTGITIMRVANGMIVEGWQNWDMLGLMQQIQRGHRAATYIGAS